MTILIKLIFCFFLEKNDNQENGKDDASNDSEEENAKRKERKQLMKVKKLIKRKKAQAQALEKKMPVNSGAKLLKKPLKQQNRAKKIKIK